MKSFIKTVNDLPFPIKLILCIPFLEIFYSVCRVINGLARKDLIWVILGILTIVPGVFFMWLIDLVWVLLYKHACGLG